MKKAYSLDYSIERDTDRTAAVYDIIDRLEKVPSNTELEQMANYILYGKDEDGTSCVDRKEIQIKTKFNSYNKEKLVSLDEMMESPTFDETIFQKNRTIYKKVKPSIDRERARDIPGMQELWAEIDKLADIIEQNQGKKKFQEGTPKLDQKQLYYLNYY